MRRPLVQEAPKTKTMTEHYQDPNSFEHSPQGVCDCYAYGADIQNCIGNDEGKPLSQLVHFREKFGCRVLVAITAWKMEDADWLAIVDVIAFSFAHFLWGLFSMKHYPEKGVGMLQCGGLERCC